MRFEHKSRVTRKQDAYLASGGGSGQDTRRPTHRLDRSLSRRNPARIGTPRIAGSNPDANMFITAFLEGR